MRKNCETICLMNQRPIKFENEEYTADVLERMLDTFIEMNQMEKAKKLYKLLKRKGYEDLARQYEARLK